MVLAVQLDVDMCDFRHRSMVGHRCGWGACTPGGREISREPSGDREDERSAKRKALR
jgi:hypothetical protein